MCIHVSIDACLDLQALKDRDALRTGTVNEPRRDKESRNLAHIKSKEAP